MDHLSCTVATFYRFVPLPDYREMRAYLFDLADSFDLKGTILLADEGINATLAGTDECVEEFLASIGSDARLLNLDVRRSKCLTQPFGKLKVRLKKEIVRLKAPVADPNFGVGEYVEPQDWNTIVRDPGTLLIDVRNRYETALGTFEGAVDPQTAEFWEFQSFVNDHLGDKNQPLAMFCTGGIRCEKATAYLVRRGFTKVKHLRGGILNYLANVAKEDSLWCGECFVFDERGSLGHGLRVLSSVKDCQLQEKSLPV